ncbi:MAG: cell division protein SepF [Oscillospiraceae bacterium]|nr:cell division protein SepF [Oscillospiraceae bacterium]
MGFMDSIRTALGFEGPEGYDDETEFPPEPASDAGEYGRMMQTQGGPGEDRSKLNISVTAQLQVILVRPEKFADTKDIANHLNNKKTVVLNLEATTPDITRRIIDFLGGVAYANGGSIKPIANNTFIITPYNVGFQGAELSSQLESNGVLL